VPAPIDSFQQDGEHLFLSNFYWHKGWTVEHHYQAAKTGDNRARAEILLADTPGQAKRLGQKCPMRADWDDVKIAVMESLLYRKFASGEMATKLLRTGQAPLIEGNRWHDQFWGDCRCGRAKCSEPGSNWLGYLLEQVRETIRISDEMLKNT